MNFAGLLRIALRALAVNKLRSALTMLGIVIGVGAVIVMIAVGAGAQARVEEQIRALGSNLLLVTPGSTTAGGVRLGFGSASTLTEDDVAAINREIPEALAAPALRGAAQVIWGNTNWSTQIYGTTPEYLDVRQWPLAAGRSFEPAEMAAAAKVCLIGATVARQLFGDADPLDQSIRIKRVPFTVIGVLDVKGQSLMGTDQDDLVLVPLKTARSRVLGTASAARNRTVGTIWVKAADGVNTKAVEAQVRSLLRQRHRLQPGVDDDFSLRNLAEVMAAQEASSRVLALLLAAVASVSLLVGGIGIMNIMLVSVTERTREIGLRMAVGARMRDILGQFLVEAVTLSLIGGLAGVALGIGASLLIAELAGWRIVLSPQAVALAVAFAFVIGVFFGFYPARKAARLNPVEALRFE
ncbi:MAG TPA: ABC transporter permease [Burkholderiales bacterium]|jgi:putative ABC transport system permease protein|nr:ABC transporter permease [Burkholderiales bacterium]